MKATRLIYDIEAKAAKERQRAAGKEHGRGQGKVVANCDKLSEDAPKPRTPRTIDRAAKAVGMSGGTLAHAKAVVEIRIRAIAALPRGGGGREFGCQKPTSGRSKDVRTPQELASPSAWVSPVSTAMPIRRLRAGGRGRSLLSAVTVPEPMGLCVRRSPGAGKFPVMDAFLEWLAAVGAAGTAGLVMGFAMIGSFKVLDKLAAIFAKD